MIFGDIGMTKTEEFGALHPVLREALLRLERTDLKGMEAGKYEWDGDRLFLLVQEPDTAPKTAKRPESHRRYVDIQLLIEGEEWIGYARKTESHVVREDELDAKDYALYEDPEDEIGLILKPGKFAVFFPDDLHRPCVCLDAPLRIKKAVVKIDLSLLGKE